MITNATLKDLNESIQEINTKYSYKIIINEHSQLSKNRLRFTIRSEKSKIKGASISSSGRNTVSASWEVHGHLFDVLIRKNFFIKTAKYKIETHEDNWKDYNIGSFYSPFYASQNSYMESAQ